MVTFKEAIIKVLEDKKEPMHFKEITNEVLKLKATNGKTPEGTVNAVLMRNSNLFNRIKTGVFELRNGQRVENKEVEKYV